MSGSSDRSLQYSASVDHVIYGTSATASYTKADWLALAFAALDQAGVSVAEQGAIRNMLSHYEPEAE